MAPSTRTAIAVADARLSTPSLWKICSRCLFTVRGLRPRIAAMSRLRLAAAEPEQHLRLARGHAEACCCSAASSLRPGARRSRNSSGPTWPMKVTRKPARLSRRTERRSRTVVRPARRPAARPWRPRACGGAAPAAASSSRAACGVDHSTRRSRGRPRAGSGPPCRARCGRCASGAPWRDGPRPGRRPRRARPAWRRSPRRPPRARGRRARSRSARS